jgi:hypothetical protein
LAALLAYTFTFEEVPENMAQGNAAPL